jgi:hypothetical protein
MLLSLVVGEVILSQLRGMVKETANRQAAKNAKSF